MQINRLFEIIYILLDKKTVTAKKLAQTLEISQRTVYRDIEILSQAGIPVYMTKGKGGGISLMPEFVLNKAVLTGEEKESILASLKVLSAVSFNEQDKALKKLSSFFGASKYDWIEIDFSSWGNADEETYIFKTAKAAILNKTVIYFDYANVKGQQSNREIEPLKLCFKGGAWYLYGYCKKKYDNRFFKLRRIKNLIVGNKTFTRSSPERIFTEENVFKEKFVLLTLKLSKEVAYRVYDEFDTYEKQEDGNFIAQINYPLGEWLFYYIASFGSYCEVLSPKDIRESVKMEYEKTLKKYM